MGIRLNERDCALLYELFTARYLATPQIVALLWREGSSERGRLVSCRRRLLQLTQHRLIRRIEVPVKRGEAPKPYIYTLDKGGAEILISELGIEPNEIDWRPKSAEENFPFLEHLLATSDLRITLSRACEQHQATLNTWINERELKSEGMKDVVTLVSPDGQQEQRAALVPDAYFALQTGNRIGHFFVEIDLGTVTVAPTAWEKRGWARKVRTYLAYYTSGMFQKRYNAKGFRVLCITTGEGRLVNLKTTTKDESGSHTFWFSTFEKLTPEAILSKPVWQRAGEDAPISILW